jgi:hypothetical protein
MALPISIESFRAAANRFPDALQVEWDAEMAGELRSASDDWDWPGLHRRHVFDLVDDGRWIVRLIVSVDYSRSLTTRFLHVSGSSLPPQAPEKLCKTVLALFWIISRQTHETPQPDHCSVNASNDAHLFWKLPATAQPQPQGDTPDGKT